MKSVIFFGASNTFGVGLHTFRECYLTEDGIKQITWPYNQTDEDNIFIKEKRWTKKVAEFLNRKEINVSGVGGSPAAILYELNRIDLLETDYIFFEFSGFYNYFDTFFHGLDYPKTPHEIEAFLTNNKNDNIELRNRIIKWIENYNPDEFMATILALFKQKVEQELSDKKIIILFWHNAFNGSTNDINSEKFDWLRKYMVKFPTKKDKDNYIVHNLLLEEKLTVSDEHPLANLFKNDIHAGIKGNDRVAEIVINYINEKETTNSWR